jgi:hypothetical protein
VAVGVVPVAVAAGGVTVGVGGVAVAVGTVAVAVRTVAVVVGAVAVAVVVGTVAVGTVAVAVVVGTVAVAVGMVAVAVGTVAVAVGTVAVGVLSVKVALTLRSWLMVRTHAPVPEQAPPQPAKVEPLAGLAVRVTTVPAVISMKQPGVILVQVIPTGVIVTVPSPLPAKLTPSAYFTRAKVAVTLRA